MQSPEWLAPRFQYNGKEKTADFGLWWNDHGARTFDLQAPHWGQVDPLAGHYEWETPYGFGHSNPVRFNDLDGREPTDPTRKMQGAALAATGAALVGVGANTMSVGVATMGVSAVALLPSGGTSTIGFGGGLATLVVGAAAVVVGAATIGTGYLWSQSGKEEVGGKQIGTYSNPKSGAKLERGENGEPLADAAAKGHPHSRLGNSRDDGTGSNQAAQFGRNDKVEKEIDFTDHGSPGAHPNPHQHREKRDENGKYDRNNSKPEPLTPD